MITNSLISIAPKYVDRMRFGRKTIEIRRRMLNLAEDSVVWVYETSPVNSVTGYFKVKTVVREKREIAWAMHSGRMGVSRNEFDSYTEGLERVVLVFFDKFFTLRDPLHLEEIQEKHASFRPPQFYSRLNNDELLMSFALAI